MPDDPVRFTTVANFPSASEAEAARLMLETEGVPAVVADGEIVSMDWLLGNAVGYVKVQVPAAHAEAAKALLARVDEERRRRRAASEADPDRPDPDALTCLACGAPMPDDADGDRPCPACGWSYLTR